ncbi:hypothetical protein BDN72DRAFT_834795 [Pluteus cervinus]|uniref:Uncharacterized protein n=1 Tax=Pluteus cervinus TaxID=181527 RepID=A0ACD3B4Y7_9AGAR|nr:hypothetical protein BDN72DRAFT_834795 [Pluteus cervinus]
MSDTTTPIGLPSRFRCARQALVNISPPSSTESSPTGATTPPRRRQSTLRDRQLETSPYSTPSHGYRGRDKSRRFRGQVESVVQDAEQSIPASIALPALRTANTALRGLAASIYRQAGLTIQRTAPLKRLPTWAEQMYGKLRPNNAEVIGIIPEKCQWTSNLNVPQVVTPQIVRSSDDLRDDATDNGDNDHDAEVLESAGKRVAQPDTTTPVPGRRPLMPSSSFDEFDSRLDSDDINQLPSSPTCYIAESRAETRSNLVFPIPDMINPITPPPRPRDRRPRFRADCTIDSSPVVAVDNNSLEETCRLSAPDDTETPFVSSTNTPVGPPPVSWAPLNQNHHHDLSHSPAASAKLTKVLTPKQNIEMDFDMQPPHNSDTPGSVYAQANAPVSFEVQPNNGPLPMANTGVPSFGTGVHSGVQFAPTSFLPLNISAPPQQYPPSAYNAQSGQQMASENNTSFAPVMTRAPTTGLFNTLDFQRTQMSNVNQPINFSTAAFSTGQLPPHPAPFMASLPSTSAFSLSNPAYSASFQRPQGSFASSSSFQGSTFFNQQPPVTASIPTFGQGQGHSFPFTHTVPLPQEPFQPHRPLSSFFTRARPSSPMPSLTPIVHEPPAPQPDWWAAMAEAKELEQKAKLNSSFELFCNQLSRPPSISVVNNVPRLIRPLPSSTKKKTPPRRSTLPPVGSEEDLIRRLEIERKLEENWAKKMGKLKQGQKRPRASSERASSSERSPRRATKRRRIHKEKKTRRDGASITPTSSLSSIPSESESPQVEDAPGPSNEVLYVPGGWQWYSPSPKSRRPTRSTRASRHSSRNASGMNHRVCPHLTSIFSSIPRLW